MSAQRVAVVSCVALLVAACQSSPPTESPSATEGVSLPSGVPSNEPPVTLGPPPSPTPPDETSPVALDPSVLAFLPESVDNAPLTESVDEATQALADPSLPTIEVEATVVEDLGSESHVIFAIDAPPVDVESVRAVSDEGERAMLIADDRRALFTAEVAEASRARPGEAIRLAVDPSRFHYFDPASGATLTGPQLATA